MNLPASLTVFCVVVFTLCFIDSTETLRCISAQCLSPDPTNQKYCQEVNPKMSMVMDECASCGESFSIGPLGKLVVLRTCEMELCMKGDDNTVHVKGPGTFAAIRCCHSDLCNNATMPIIPFSEEIPVIEGVEVMEQIDPAGGKHWTLFLSGFKTFSLSQAAIVFNSQISLMLPPSDVPQ